MWETAEDVFDSFKEALLLTRFVYCLICSWSLGEALQDLYTQLKTGLYSEYTRLESFGRCFLTDHEFLDVEIATAPWLPLVGRELAALRDAFGDIAKLALAIGGEYQQYSPDVNYSNVLKHNLGFSWGFGDAGPIDVHDLALSIRDKEAALCQPERLGRILKRVQRCNAQLEDLVPRILALHPRWKDTLPGALERYTMMVEENGFLSEVKFHLEIRAITGGHVGSWDRTRKIKGVLKPLHKASGLTPGYLTRSGEAEGRPVLFECKLASATSSSKKLAQGHWRLAQLAQLLEKAATGPAWHLRMLRFEGISEHLQNRCHTLVFSYPDDVSPGSGKPTTLHSILASPDRFQQGISIVDRFRIACSTAKSVARLHADCWLHKNISSHTIVFFDSEALPPEKRRSAQINFRKPYLVGFEYTRPVGSETISSLDNGLEQNIYRHPARQGMPSESFNETHDIYALGVVLLEIGLWTTAREVFREQNGGVELTQESSPSIIRHAFLEAAKARLPAMMGCAFARAVERCFLGWKSDPETSGAVPAQNTQALFLDSITRSLDIIRLLDDEDDDFRSIYGQYNPPVHIDRRSHTTPLPSTTSVTPMFSESH